MDSKSEASAKKDDKSAKDNSEDPTMSADQTSNLSKKRKLSTIDVTSMRPNKEPEDVKESSRFPDSAHGEKMVLRGKRSMPSDESTEKILNASTSSLKENIPALKVRKVKSRDNNDDMDDPESDAAVADKGNRPFKCTKCKKSFLNRANLSSHCESHTGEHLIQCHICYKLIRYKKNIERHMKINHSGSTSSPVRSKNQCSKIPAARSGHMICLFPSCGEEIPRKEMQKHVWDHEVLSGAKPYKCSDCAQSFPTKHQLKWHSAIHTGELVVQCPYCDLSCSQIGNLNRHVKLKHSAETGHSGTRSKANPKRTGLRKKNKIGINDVNYSESEADECSGSNSLDSSHVDQQLSTSSYVTPVLRVQRQCRERDGTSVVERQMLKSFLPKNWDILDFSLPPEHLNMPDMKLTQSEEKPDNSQVPKDDHRLAIEFDSTPMDVGHDEEELQSFESVAPVILNHVSADYTQNHGQNDGNIAVDPTNAKQEDIVMDVDLCNKQSTEILPDNEIRDVSSSLDKINCNERAGESIDDVKDEPEYDPDAVVETEQKLRLCEAITSDILNIVHTVTEQNRIHDDNIVADSYVAGIGIQDTVQDKEKTSNVDESEDIPDYGIIPVIKCSADDVNNIVKSEEDNLEPESLETVVRVSAKSANGILKKQNEPNNNNMGEVLIEPKLEDFNVDVDLSGGKVENNINKQLDKPSDGNNNKLETGPQAVVDTSTNVTCWDDIVLVYESKPLTEESQNVDDDLASIRSGPVFREHYPDNFSSAMSDGPVSDLYQADDEHTDCAAGLEAINRAGLVKPEVRTMEGTSHYKIEKLAKRNIHTQYVVWCKDFSHDIACSVEANSQNTMLIVEKLKNRQEFELVKLLVRLPQIHIFVGDDGQQKLHCFMYGGEFLAKTPIFRDLKEFEGELTTFASSHSKSLVHIIEEDWFDQLARKLDEPSVRF